MIHRSRALLAWTLSFTFAAAAAPVRADFARVGEHSSELADESVSEIDPAVVPERPKRFEAGAGFLSPGVIRQGIRLPGGAVWQPSLLISGTSRTALQVFDTGEDSLSEIATRLDLYADVLLTGTERFTLGLQPLHRRDDGRFTVFNLNPRRDERGNRRGFEEEANLDVTTAFFEGELAELIPALDPGDYAALDIGFAIGRQYLSIQDGLLINDTLDAIGITRNNLAAPAGGTNLQLTAVFAWDEIHRGNNGFNNREVDDLRLYGLFAAADYARTSINAEFVYVDDTDEDPAKFGGGDGVYWAFSASQRIGLVSSDIHLLGSRALDDESAVLSDGMLLFLQTTTVLPYSEDNLYVNLFWGIDEFTSAARGPEVGGPLGELGILFASLELGRYDTALPNDATQSVGFAIGYQMFLDTFRKQLVFELGGRKGTDNDAAPGAIALAVRYQQAVGSHWELQFDLFGSLVQSDSPGFGSRMELRYAF